MQLIDNVLWLTTLNSGDATADVVKVFDMRAIVDEASQRHEAVMRDKKLNVAVELPDTEVVIATDRMKVERIFQNVFNNAVKFTNQGTIKVTLRTSADGAGVELTVADTGVGIEASKLAAILEPFQQVQGAVERACGGLGLGLTVAYRITQMLGGTLYIESELGVGTTVKLTLPLQNRQGKVDEPGQRLPS